MMKKILTTSLLAVAILFGATTINAQPAKVAEAKSTKQEATGKTAQKDPLSIEKFIKSETEVQKGLTPTFKQDGKFYIQINDTLLNRDIRVVSRIVKAAADIRDSFSGYAGDIINSAMVQFKRVDNKIYLTSSSFSEISKEVMPENVANSNYPAIIAAFEIKAQSNDKKEAIIDITDFLLSDSEYIFFKKSFKQGFKFGGLQKDKSYIHQISTYPINTEFKIVATYSRTIGNPTATYMLNSSFVLLPKVPMTPRYADKRVGYFTVSYQDFDKNPQKVERQSMITRWRLEPKPEDVEKYKRGELVEPVKPIIFYIDPATPKEWVPYLIQGVNDWQKAFEKAGFKNAIMGKVAPTPEEDPTWSLEDARYSAIVYKPSSTPNASGPHINDPRSGEIIESHINWYHNVMSLLRNWYFIQCSPVDPAARKMIFDTELMGQLVRFVSSHEVGHTLGLRHNFAGTALYTAKQLRDPKFLKENGHTTSIMDYSRFNYVAQPGDNIPRESLFPRIAIYDEWAIEWGYKRFPDIDDATAELPMINEWIIEKNKDPRYFFGTESNPDDPRFQSEDLGCNQMETNALGIANLKYIMEHLEEWTKEPNKDYTELRTLYNEVVSQYKRYTNHVIKWIGGAYLNEKNAYEDGPIYTHVEKAKQKEALSFLKKHLFTPQLWLTPNNILEKSPLKSSYIIESLYKGSFKNLLSNRVMNNLINDEVVNGSKAFTIDEYFKELNNIIFNQSIAAGEKGVHTRILQKSYVEGVIALYKGLNKSMGNFRVVSSSNNTSLDNSDITSYALFQLNEIKAIADSKKELGNSINKAHFAYISSIIEETLSNKKK